MGYTQEFLDEIVTISKIRVNFYAYFSTIFREPIKEEFIGTTNDFLPHFEELGEFLDSEKFNSAIKLLHDYNKVEKAAKDKKAFLDEINRQYTCNYLLGQSSVATSASVHLSSEKLVKQAPWEEVLKIYKSRNFVMPASFKEPEDHISMELLYLQQLSELMLNVINNNSTDKISEILKEEKEFINKHILTWAEEFASQTEKVSIRVKSILYPAVADIMVEFLKYDVGLTDELLEDI